MGEVAPVSETAGAYGPLRFAWAFLPYLLLLIILAAYWAVDNLELYFLFGIPVALFGTHRALTRVRASLQQLFPQAPVDAALLLGGQSYWRDIGLAWIDGPFFCFATARQYWRCKRSEIERIDFRGLARELVVTFRQHNTTTRLRLGALVSLRELPRFHRQLSHWHRNGQDLPS